MQGRARRDYVDARFLHLLSPHPAGGAPWRSPLALQENASHTGNEVWMDSRLDQQQGCEEPSRQPFVFSSRFDRMIDGIAPSQLESEPADVGAAEWLSAAGCSGCWSQAEATQRCRLPRVDSRANNTLVGIHPKQQAGGIEPCEHAVDMFWPGHRRVPARWGCRGDPGRCASSRGSAWSESVCWQPGGSSISLMLQVPHSKIK